MAKRIKDNHFHLIMGDKYMERRGMHLSLAAMVYVQPQWYFVRTTITP